MPDHSRCGEERGLSCIAKTRSIWYEYGTHRQVLHHTDMRLLRSILITSLLTGAATEPMLAQTSAGATFIGKIYADTTMRPIEGAEVTLSALARSSTSDSKGAFRFNNISPGTYRVRARRVGFVPFEAAIEFRAGETVQRGIVLPRLTVLDSVRVVGEVNVPLSFLENRARGFGHFLTRDELDKQGNRRLADIILQVPGLGIVQGRGGQGWILSKRVPPRLRRPTTSGIGEDLYSPGAYERSSGLVPGCYARVYLDAMLLNASTPAEPVNVNEFSGSVEAIEYYSGPAQTPDRYSRLNSTCGVLVLHTRRSP